MKRKFKQWWSSIPPISTKRTINSHLNWTHKIQKKHGVWRWISRSWFRTGTTSGELNRLMESQPSPLDILIFPILPICMHVFREKVLHQLSLFRNRKKGEPMRVLITFIFPDNVLYCIYTAMSCIHKILKFTRKKTKTCVWSSLYIRHRIPGDFMHLVDI